jgi:glycine hydroxymethyltransferase
MLSRTRILFQRSSLRVGARYFTTLPNILTKNLKEVDPDVFDIVENEKRRQRDSLALIPSENFTSVAVLDALGSIMQNKYSEGYPGARYYGGNEFIDKSERLCQQRALDAFDLDPALWGVNVQPLSGSPANFEVYTAVLKPHERMMALDLPHGGHLSHGYQTPTKKISAVSVYFECLPYRLDENTGLIDYDTLEKNSILYRPKLLVSGASAYSRHIDYARLRAISNNINALFMFDMAHISGLIAGKALPSPFPYADIVTTTTHKSLRGPRGAMIFYRKGVRKEVKGKPVMYELEDPINQSVFPGHQGGPHNHTITALAVALKQAKSSEFQKYQQQVVKNMQAAVKALNDMGYTLVSGGTDNHLVLINLHPKGVNGARVERVMELVNISLNKNTVPGDVSAMNPGGIRIGSPALTSRGLVEADFIKVAQFLDRGIKLAIEISAKSGAKTTEEFKKACTVEAFPALVDLRNEVTQFARQFPVVGFDQSSMVYKD